MLAIPFFEHAIRSNPIIYPGGLSTLDIVYRGRSSRTHFYSSKNSKHQLQPTISLFCSRVKPPHHYRTRSALRVQTHSSGILSQNYHWKSPANERRTWNSMTIKRDLHTNQMNTNWPNGAAKRPAGGASIWPRLSGATVLPEKGALPSGFARKCTAQVWTRDNQRKKFH